jgi:RNA polymerase sigma factor (TIGR02999 family)
MNEGLAILALDARTGSSCQITERLAAWSKGDASAREDVLNAVYSELRMMADRYLQRERPDHTLQPTALVHEAYLRLVGQTRVSWQNRSHFFGVAAQMMRRILVDHARTRNRQKRGGAQPRLALEQVIDQPECYGPDLVALDAALSRLAEFDLRKSRVVELRFFGGLSVEETAQVLDVSSQTVQRDWQVAKAWLYQEMLGTTDF